MTDVVDIEGLKQALEGVGSQISTAINIEKVRKMIPHQNLLINWYFPLPVIQRGGWSWSSSGVYTIDRWKLISGNLTRVRDVGLTLNGVLQQILEFPIGQDTVCTVLTTDGLLDPDRVEYNDQSRIFQITGKGETLVAAKLEVGGHQSLVKNVDGTVVLSDPPPNYGDEINRCMRYYEVSNVTQTFPVGTTMFNVEYRQYKRGTPRVTFATINPSANSVAADYLDLGGFRAKLNSGGQTDIRWIADAEL